MNHSVDSSHRSTCSTIFLCTIDKDSVMQNLVKIIVVRIECWLVGSYDSTSYSTSTVLWLYSGSFLPCFPLFLLCFLCFFLFFLLGSSVFPLFSLLFLLGSSVFTLFSLFISLNSIKNLLILLTNCVTFLVLTFFHRPTDPT